MVYRWFFLFKVAFFFGGGGPCEFSGGANLSRKKKTLLRNLDKNCAATVFRLVQIGVIYSSQLLFYIQDVIVSYCFRIDRESTITFST